LKHAIKLELLTPAQERILALQRIEADRDIDLLEKTLKETKPRKGSKLYTNIQASLEQAQKVKDHAVCAFMERNIRLAVKIAGDMGFLPAPLEGRVSSGLEGLRDAALRFDPDKGGKFSTYAAFWIKQRIFRDSRAESRTIRLSSNMIARLSKVTRAESDLQFLYGRAATDAEIAEHVGLNQKQMRAVRLAQQTMAVSLEPQADDIHSINYQETLADPNALIPGTSDAASDRLTILHTALTSLNQRERTVIFARFGLNKTGERLTLEELGQQFGVTRERIRQLENTALTKLKKAFEGIDTPNLVLLEMKRNISSSQE
jgi:RNA polymerase primary sigma factor